MSGVLCFRVRPRRDCLPPLIDSPFRILRCPDNERDGDWIVKITLGDDWLGVRFLLFLFVFCTMCMAGEETYYRTDRTLSVMVSVWFRVSRRRSMSQHQGYTATAIVRFCRFCHFSSKSSHTDITSIVLMESVYVEDILFWQRSASGLHGGRAVGLLSATYSSHLRPL